MNSLATRENTYNNGQPYRQAQGRFAPRESIIDNRATVHPVVVGRPSREQFIRAIVRELKIRFYSRRTIKAYRDKKRKIRRFSIDRFLQRFLLHVPPPHQHMVRAFGLYAPNQVEHLAICRKRLGLPVATAPDPVTWQDLLVKLGHAAAVECPQCGQRLITERILPAPRSPPRIPRERAYKLHSEGPVNRVFPQGAFGHTFALASPLALLDNERS